MENTETEATLKELCIYIVDKIEEGTPSRKDQNGRSHPNERSWQTWRMAECSLQIREYEKKAGR